MVFFKKQDIFVALICLFFSFDCYATALPPVGMVKIPSGSFEMGCGDECPMEDAKPVHTVYMDSFYMDITPVTNESFAAFVRATRYKTYSEKKPKAADYPGVPVDQLKAGSAVFTPRDVGLENSFAWWEFVPGASWEKPFGPKGEGVLKKYANYPVVHVTFDDAQDYCRWHKKDLPTEAQFEYAARGGLVRKKYAWGDELKPGGKWVVNIWQGKFPKKDEAEDGYAGLSPVDAFPKNNFGLYDMAGNVWQWCRDFYRPDSYRLRLSKKLSQNRNPEGPADSFDPGEPGIEKRVQRGGSYLCSDQFCTRYLVGSRGRGSRDSSSSNLGFRCVQKIP